MLGGIPASHAIDCRGVLGVASRPRPRRAMPGPIFARIHASLRQVKPGVAAFRGRGGPGVSQRGCSAPRRRLSSARPRPTLGDLDRLRSRLAPFRPDLPRSRPNLRGFGTAAFRSFFLNFDPIWLAFGQTCPTCPRVNQVWRCRPNFVRFGQFVPGHVQMWAVSELVRFD